MSTDKIWKTWRRRLWRPTWRRNDRPFFELAHARVTSVELIRFFYLFNFYVWCQRIDSWQKGHVTSVIVRPTWPVFWVNLTNCEFWAMLFLWFCFLASIPAFLWPRFRAARVLAFVGLFFETAILASDVAGWERMILHVYDFTLISFLFIFLPENGDRSTFANWKMSLMMTLSKITIIVSFTASAIWRTRMSINQALSGMGWDELAIGPGSYKGFLMSVASLDGLFPGREMRGVLGPALAASPWICSWVMLVGMTFELSGVFILFQPRLYRAYGILCGSFFVFLLITMDLTFWEHFLIAILFLVK